MNKHKRIFIIGHSSAGKGILAKALVSVPPLGVWRGSKWIRNDDKMILLSQCAFLENEICSSIGKYELVDNNHVIQTEVEEYEIRIYKPKALTEILKNSGFSRVRTIKAFDRKAKPSDNDESIVYECKK